jgi:hypothetical protein
MVSGFVVNARPGLLANQLGIWTRMTVSLMKGSGLWLVKVLEQFAAQ